MQPLLNKGGQQPQPEQPPQGPQEPQQGSADQDKYDTVVGNILNHLYSNADAIVDTVKANPEDLPSRIGTVLSQLISMSHMAAKSANQQIPPRMMFQATVEAAQAVGELLLDRQVVSPDQEAQITEDGFYLALEQIGSQGTLTDAERQEYLKAMDDFDAMAQQTQGGQPNVNG